MHWSELFNNLLEGELKTYITLKYFGENWKDKIGAE